MTTGRRLTVALGIGIAFAGGCKAPNEAFCCLTLEDCLEHGVEGETRPCDDGLACKENACVVPSCSTDGCAATAPTCDTASDVCVGCTESVECSRFPDSNMCDPASGSCVECLTSDDCGVNEPYCDAGSCRGCELDSECASGACGDDGTCTSPEQIVYLHPDGSDAGNCTQAVPCKSFFMSISKTSPTRNHFVLAPGVYMDAGMRADSTTTTATSLVVHGGGATATRGDGDGESMFELRVPTTLRDLNINFGPFGEGIGVHAPTELERVNVVAPVGVYATSAVTLRDVTIEATSASSISLSGSLTADRVVLHGGTNGIFAQAGATTNIMNMLVFDTSDVGLNLAGVSTGSLTFITVADTGRDVGTGDTGVTCSSTNVVVRSSIIWGTGSTGSKPISGCTVAATTIAGPYGSPMPNVMNVDPKFVNAAGHDYHLATTSPAKDVAEAGPPIDFEGDPRPAGAKYDLGADEIRP